MSLLFEAARAAFLACSYLLHILALAVIALWGVRPRLPAWAVFYASTVVFAWIPFAEVDPLVDGRWAGAAAVAGGLFLVDRRRAGGAVEGAGRGALRYAGGLAGTALAGAFAGAVWLPCVGPELGRVLTSAVSDPGPGLGGLAVYLLGAMWPTLALAAGADFFPSFSQILEGRAARTASRAAGALIAAAVAFGFYPSILSALAQWSSR